MSLCNCTGLHKHFSPGLSKLRFKSKLPNWSSRPLHLHWTQFSSCVGFVLLYLLKQNQVNLGVLFFHFISSICIWGSLVHPVNAFLCVSSIDFCFEAQSVVWWLLQLFNMLKIQSNFRSVHIFFFFFFSKIFSFTVRKITWFCFFLIPVPLLFLFFICIAALNKYKFANDISPTNLNVLIWFIICRLPLQWISVTSWQCTVLDKSEVCRYVACVKFQASEQSLLVLTLLFTHVWCLTLSGIIAVWTVSSNKVSSKTSECLSIKSSRGMQLLQSPNLLLVNFT